ncbi:MAG TPA: ABC transporter permease [Opitutaceae bacterium]|nr:ABC transporter permease [Opitutaceae bacterium]
MKRLLFEFTESIRIAAQQIRANRMRSFLTMLGVIIGIIAVTLMGTAIGGIDVGVNRSLAMIGDDVVYVQKWPWRGVEDWWNFRNRRQIHTAYAEQINEYIAANPDSALKLAVPADGLMSQVFRGDKQVTGIFTLGINSDLPRISKVDMADGRFFSEVESRAGRNVTVIGFDVSDALFPGESPLGREVRIKGQNFVVIGVIARQGSFLGLWSMDSVVMIPLTALNRYFRTNSDSAEIRVQLDKSRFQDGKMELTGVMRRVRRLGPEQKNDFEINEQEAIRETLAPLRNGVAFAGMFITGLSLFVGAIGIMNITYVSVKERTREIGTRKALGARRRTILMQFLVEAVSICVIGGAIGLGIAVGLAGIVGAAAPNFPMAISPSLVITGLTISILTGVFSGFAPAWGASKLDPVEALRYE